MRSDMFKVIVERPRVGGKYSREPKLYIKGEAEDLPKQESISKKWKIHYGGKNLNENLSPLKRFLRSRIGQRWDDVWSEICEQLDNGSAVKKHVKDHAIQYVETNILMVDGNPYYHSMSYKSGGWRPLYSRNRWTEFYVNPDTGILCTAPKEPEKPLKPDWWKTIKCDDGSYHEYLDGVWWNVLTTVEKRLVKEPLYEYKRDPDTGKKEYKFWGRYYDKIRTVETKTRRQLNKKDIKALKKWFKDTHGLVL